VRRFRDLRKVTTTAVIRTLAADLSMLPVMLASISVMSMTGSKRDAQNFTSAVYPAIASALSGVTLNVIGEKNLWAARPAVFVFNHQSKIDPVIVSKLLYKDFVGVGKKEVAALPFADKLMEFGGAVLIDRADSVGAVAALKPLVNVIRDEEKSVIMAPEGTRTVSPKLAPFKKGPFHLAMQAEVPMVPIVLHDAIDIAPKGTFLYRPGTVTVEVLPPVDTSDWSAPTIDQHVAEVRGLFLSALGQEEPEPKPARSRKTGSRKSAPRKKATAKRATKKKPASGKAPTGKAGGAKAKSVSRGRR
jgi:putative phosphoserine phosphatase/1-acylglycerol-3-phosphate O-acyltransferase